MLLVSVALFILLGPQVFGQGLGSSMSPDLGNAQYFKFAKFGEYISKCSECSRVLDELEPTDDESGRKVKPTLAWLKKREDRWVSAFKTAAAILPRSFFEKIGETTWHFYVDQETFYTAHPGAVNLLPSMDRPDWMIWEPLPVDGYSEEEMIFVAFHELAHIYDRPYYSSTGLCYYQKQGISQWANGHLNLTFSPKTFFPEISGCWEDSTTFYGHTNGVQEDFAESFALYIMWPEYLKNNFPMHYEVIRTILSIEYPSTYSMPNSIKTRLTVGGSNAADR